MPDVSGEDEVASEPTKVGDGRLALEEAVRASLGSSESKDTPDDRATAKMAPFQLEQVLERVAESPPERSQARMKAPSQPPQASSPLRNEPQAVERATLPGPGPASLPARPPGTPSAGGIASAVTTLVAVIFIGLVCVVLLSR